jgi:hypothetical protein
MLPINSEHRILRRVEATSGGTGFFLHCLILPSQYLYHVFEQMLVRTKPSDNSNDAFAVQECFM